MSRCNFEAVIFDLDGVVTRTASVHAGAWKLAFDEYMKLREKRDGEPFREFTIEEDYRIYVDGKPRYEGVRSFLESRNIHIPFGEPTDAPETETVCGIGNRKNENFTTVLEEKGAEVFGSTVELIKRLKESGVRIGVASSSKNCQKILQKTGLEALFETRVDGVVSAQLGLKGKPEGDIFVRAAHNLEAERAKSVVVEDATSGVLAGRNGGFNLVIGIARENNHDALLEHGADVVVSDLAEINIEWIQRWFARQPRPFFESWKQNGNGTIEQAPGEPRLHSHHLTGARPSISNGKKLAFFLDYDGALTPIVEKPELATLDEDTRAVISELARRHTVGIISGRLREDVQNLVQLPGIFYAGSHGMDIEGPGFSYLNPKAEEVLPVMGELIAYFTKELGGIKGIRVEDKKFSVAVHYRLVAQADLPKIEAIVREAVRKERRVRLMAGRRVFEVLPYVDWNKGMALRCIVNELKISWDGASVIYVGDDTTDEYAFRTVRTRGVGVLVADEPRSSAADFIVSSPAEVRSFFEEIIRDS